MKVKLIKHNDDVQVGRGGFDDTRIHLIVGQEYDAVIDEHEWHTFIIIDGKRFNSVVFKYETIK